MKGLFRSVASIVPNLNQRLDLHYILPFYHIIADVPPAHVKHLYRVMSPVEFEKDLDYLLKSFQPVDANELFRTVTGNLKQPKPLMMLSFDDGFREAVDIVIPILLKKGIPAVFFINPPFINNQGLMLRCKISVVIERLLETSSTKIQDSELKKISGFNGTSLIQYLKKMYNDSNGTIDGIAQIIGIDFNSYLSTTRPYLTESDLEKINQLGFGIGSHGYQHKHYSELTLNEQVNDVAQSINWIRSRFHQQMRLFAFPFTDFGVQSPLFSILHDKSNPMLDISFGTAGIRRATYFRHLQRIPMEVKNAEAKKIVKGEILYYIAKQSVGYHNSEHG